eukprot:3220783-Alexandrium_andersonii.AAC.1
MTSLAAAYPEPRTQVVVNDAVPPPLVLLALGGCAIAILRRRLVFHVDPIPWGYPVRRAPFPTLTGGATTEEAAIPAEHGVVADPPPEL